MTHLNILTENNLGTAFWSKYTGEEVKIVKHPINFEALKLLLHQQESLILVDFYFKPIPETKEVYLTKKIEQVVKQANTTTHLFFISPNYAIQKPKIEHHNLCSVFAHNFSDSFLQYLEWITSNLNLKNHPKAS